MSADPFEALAGVIDPRLQVWWPGDDTAEPLRELLGDLAKVPATLWLRLAAASLPPLTDTAACYATAQALRELIGATEGVRRQGKREYMRRYMGKRRAQRKAVT